MTDNVIQITDSCSDASAHILVNYGFNCFRFTVPTQAGETDLLWAASDFQAGHPRPSGSGIPVLFPFPGRIQGMEFEWEGKKYQQESEDGQGNAIHGFVHKRPWRLVEQKEDRVIAEFQASVDAPELLNHWPGDFQIRGDYHLHNGKLTGRFQMLNPGETVLPVGMGLHPYFRLPLGGEDAEACQVHVPVGSEWELKAMNATGKSSSLDSDHPLRTGAPLAQTEYDNVFGTMGWEDAVCSSMISDPASGQNLKIQFGKPFRECVIYTPPHREAICIEPYTSVPDPFRLAREGIDAGLICLDPGETIETWLSMQLER